jgi:K+ transporter
LAAAFGLLVTGTMVLVKVLPAVPGHFTRYEWLALAVWAAIGFFITLPVSGTYRQSAHKVMEEIPAGKHSSRS